MSAAWCLASRWDSRRIRSIARLPAVVVSQPPGLGGTPSRGQRFDRGQEHLAGRLPWRCRSRRSGSTAERGPSRILTVVPLRRGRRIGQTVARSGRRLRLEAGQPRPLRRRPWTPRRPLQASVKVQELEVAEARRSSLPSTQRKDPSVTDRLGAILSTNSSTERSARGFAPNTERHSVHHLLVQHVHGLEDRLHRVRWSSFRYRRRCRHGGRSARSSSIPRSINDRSQ